MVEKFGKLTSNLFVLTSYTLFSKKAKVESWRQNLKQKPQRDSLYWFSQLLFSHNSGPPAQG